VKNEEHMIFKSKNRCEMWVVETPDKLIAENSFTVVKNLWHILNSTSVEGYLTLFCVIIIQTIVRD
jgi:hypothetical protein